MTIRSGVAMAAGCLLLATPGFALAQQNTSVRFGETQSPALAAQVAPPLPAISLTQEPQEPEQGPEEQMGTSGFFLGVIGMLAGAAIGSQVGQADCPARAEDKDCVGRHAYTGALIAGTLFVPVGVHIASKGGGNLLTSLGLSVATGGLSYFAFKAIPGSPIAMAPFVAAPIQVITSVKVERRR